MTSFSIKDLSDFSGIKPHTIRIWEQRFTFLKPQRNETLRRLYSTGELNVLLDVSLLNQSGLKVSRIAKMTHEEKARLVLQLDLAQQQQRHIHDLIICMAEMDSERFEQVLDSSILYYGIHTSIVKVIIPFCERVGLLQKLDNKNYIENILLIKEIVKNKIHFGIEKSTKIKTQEYFILLFLPFGEHQELLLLIMNYLLKMEGFKTIYLGKHITVDNMERISHIKMPSFIITHLLERNYRNDLARFVTSLPEVLPQTKMITIGNPLAIAPGSHYKTVDSMGEVLTLVGQEKYENFTKLALH